MRKNGKFWALALSFFLLGMAEMIPDAGAQNWDLRWEADPPNFWRILTENPDEDTSPCLGSAETPVCSLESFMACRHVGHPASCRLYPDAALRPEIAHRKNIYYRYRIFSVLLVKDGDERFKKVKAMPGDYIVGMVSQGCNKIENYCSYIDKENRGFFLMRSEDNRWIRVDALVDFEYR